MTLVSPVAVIPALDEEKRIGSAVGAFRAQGVEVVVMANGCVDDTVSVARDAGAYVLVSPRLLGGVGEARARGCEAALRRYPQTPMLITSDADCRIAPGAIDVLRGALEGADAAAGRVVPDPTEFAALPIHVRVHGALEDRRDAILAEISARIRPLVYDPFPRHSQTPGALLAFRAAAYRAIGGFAFIRCSEDRDIIRRLGKAGFTVAHPWNAVVIASCRLQGRAVGGMADTIAERTLSNLNRATRRLERQCEILTSINSALINDGGSAIDNLCDLVWQRSRSFDSSRLKTKSESCQETTITNFI